MGLARITCASGCSCQPSLVDGLWRQRTSLMQMHSLTASWGAVGWLVVWWVGGGGGGTGAAADCPCPLAACLPDFCTGDACPSIFPAHLQVSQHPACRLRVTIVPRPGQRAGDGEAGGKFQLAAVMVAHTPVVLSSYERQAADLGKMVD